MAAPNSRVMLFTVNTLLMKHLSPRSAARKASSQAPRAWCGKLSRKCSVRKLTFWGAAEKLIMYICN